MICVTCAAVKAAEWPIHRGDERAFGRNPGLATGPIVKSAGLNVPGVTPFGAVV